MSCSFAASAYPDERGECRRTLLDADQRGRILERNLAVLCPAESRRTMCEDPGLLVHECFSLSQTHDRRIPHGSLGLLAGAHSGHEQYLTRQER